MYIHYLVQDLKIGLALLSIAGLAFILYHLATDFKDN